MNREHKFVDVLITNIARDEERMARLKHKREAWQEKTDILALYHYHIIYTILFYIILYHIPSYSSHHMCHHMV